MYWSSYNKSITGRQVTVEQKFNKIWLLNFHKLSTLNISSAGWKDNLQSFISDQKSLENKQQDEDFLPSNDSYKFTLSCAGIYRVSPQKKHFEDISLILNLWSVFWDTLYPVPCLHFEGMWRHRNLYFAGKWKSWWKRVSFSFHRKSVFWLKS